MLGIIKSKFDYADFTRRLRHYFADSSPITADIELRLDEVTITNKLSGKSVTININRDDSESDAVFKVISECERSLYPIVLRPVKKIRPLTLEQQKHKVLQGVPVRKLASETEMREVLTVVRIYQTKPGVVLKNPLGAKTVYYLNIPSVYFIEKMEALPETERWHYLSGFIIKQEEIAS